MSTEKEPAIEAVDSEMPHLGDPTYSHSAATPAVCAKLGNPGFSSCLFFKRIDWKSRVISKVVPFSLTILKSSVQTVDSLTLLYCVVNTVGLNVATHTKKLFYVSIRPLVTPGSVECLSYEKGRYIDIPRFPWHFA